MAKGTVAAKLSAVAASVPAMLKTLAVHGYRSLRDVVLPLGELTVVTGANGVGKSNLYRALALLGEAASGRLIGALARAGGLASVLWAGPETISGAMKRGEVPVEGTAGRRRPVSLMLGFASEGFSYLIDVGLPPPSQSLFVHDAQIKREAIWAGPVLRPAAVLASRVGAGLPGHLSLLAELADPRGNPEVSAVRREVMGWRLYDGFRTDAGAPARRPCPGTRTDALAADGGDLAPAVQTILESAWARPLADAVAAAFDGARLEVSESLGLFAVSLRQRGMLRPLEASEWSDGTLRFVCVATALLSPAPPPLLVLNEPEASLHPSLLGPLAELVRQASGRGQVLVVTHHEGLAEALGGGGAVCHELVKPHGETEVAGQGVLTRPTWEWGSRRR